MEKRSIWQKVFGGFVKVAQNLSRFQFMSGHSPTFSSFGTNAYASDVVRSAIHSVASNAAKLKPKHIRSVEGQIKLPRSKLERQLAMRPNPLMSTYDFLYKVITILMLRSNSFILINRDAGSYTGFYPIDYSVVESREFENELFLKFYLSNGKQMTVPYADVIHIRRFFNGNDLFGDGNDDALLPTLELINTINQGIINAIKTSAFVRGILKFTQNLSPDDRKKQKDEFVRDYLSVGNNGGIAATDVKADFQPLTNEPKLIDAKQMALVENKVNKYFGTNEKIIMANYTEDEWNAFYSTTLEPLALQLGLEFSEKCFSKTEQSHGNEIIFSANRLAYASNQTKVNMAKELIPLGLFTINEMREVFELEPVEGGDKRMQTLNLVNADKADVYQKVDGKVSENEDENDGGDDGDAV